MIVYISIGNSDDKLTQKEWSNFVADVDDVIEEAATQVHGRWFSQSDAEWQNACWCVEINSNWGRWDNRVMVLRSKLATHARTYGQDSIAWAPVKETEFLK
jgi:hypothetical protein